MAYRNKERARARVEVSGMAAAVDDYVRFGGRVVDCGAELSSMAQRCRVWRRVFECGAELLGSAGTVSAGTWSGGTVLSAGTVSAGTCSGL